MSSSPHRILSARHHFPHLPISSSPSTWNTLLKTSPPHHSLPLYFTLLQTPTPPNKFTFTFLLKSITKLSSPHLGIHLHSHLIKFGFGSDPFLQTALIGVYADAGLIKVAEKVFDEMSERDVVAWTALVSGYAKCGRVDDARRVFDEMPKRNAVSWAAVVSGYSQCGRHQEALNLFEEIRYSNVQLTEGMVISVLSSAAHCGSLDVGKWVHEYVERNGMRLTASIGTALVNMYAKCGCIDDAIQVFGKMSQRDAFSWTAMVSALSVHGKGQQALARFEEMLSIGLKPDHVTFVGVLSACSHAGFIDEGRYYFRCMKEVYKIAPHVEHYGCMIDILGRGGYVEEAWNLVQKMPMKPDRIGLKSLLSASASYGNVECAEWAAKKLIELDKDCGEPYILLGNAYAKVGRWADAERVRKMMRVEKTVKIPGHSLVEIDGVFHHFVTGNYEEQPCIEEIKSLLQKLGKVSRLALNASD
ncbi:hypothetical protein ACHQM5_006887 [Ranunculus cassubicifolius]